jgi:hypothetical protein
LSPEGGGVSNQLPLRYDGRSHLDGVWAELVEEIRSVVAVRGLKEVAFDLDVSPSQLSHSLSERASHYLRANWIPYFVTHAPTHRIVELLAELRGLETRESAPLSADEDRNSLREVIRRKFSPDIARALLADAESMARAARRRE